MKKSPYSYTQCITPYRLESGQDVPCGKCLNCLRKRVEQWTFRIQQELKVATSAYFITLTYGHEKIPISKNGFRTLSKQHAKDFCKRLRENMRRDKLYNLRYFLCGEYGGKKGRPHYHAVVFNAMPEHIIDAWSYVRDGKRYEYGTYQLDPDVNQANIRYILKYMHKDKSKKKGKDDDRQVEFQLMSKGLGRNYLSEKVKRYHLEGEHTYVFLDKAKIGIPRYFKEKIFSKEHLEEINISIMNRILEKQDEFVKNMLKLHGDDWRDAFEVYIRSSYERAGRENCRRKDL